MGTRFLLMMLFFLGAAIANGDACKPFRVHLKSPLPPLPPPNTLDLSEAQLLEEISQRDPKFPKAFENAMNTTAAERIEYLNCVLHYVQMDTDGDGISDWTAVVDQKASRTLHPLDKDIDGDGVDNTLDPNPLDKKNRGLLNGDVPTHLRSADRTVLKWQSLIYKDYGILAVNHTADHSSEVLKEFHGLLKKSFSQKFIRSLKIKTLYAFEKYDGKYDIAAYHHHMQALSIGGNNVYSKEISAVQKQDLLSTLAHEMGHAVLLKKIAPRDLRQICEQHGWKDVFKSQEITSFYDEDFFKRHPGWKSNEEAHKNNFFTDYSYSNAHEWFADAFAKVILEKDQKPSQNSPHFQKWLTSYLW